MAYMVNNISDSYYGEAIVWKAFEQHLDQDVVVYNNNEIQGLEFDFCALFPNIGILVVEVKGWKSNQIEVLANDKIKIMGYSDYEGSPKKQANKYRYCLLREIENRFKLNPLVASMVCYPFISKDEFYSLGLDVVSSEKLTILKEDIEDQSKLMNKINLALNQTSNNVYTYDMFDQQLLYKVRGIFEPEFRKLESVKSSLYSELRVISTTISDEEMNHIVDQYFNGVKQILFVKGKKDYLNCINLIESKFKEYGISSKGMDLIFQSNATLETFKTKKNMKLFNFELYFLDTIFEEQSIYIVDGVLNDNSNLILKSLAQSTSFNYDQYMVEHSNAEENVLVKAGAGTGKTFSMISRISYLCNKGLNNVESIKDEVVMVTFTNEAADNMKTKLKTMFMNYVILTGKTKYHWYIREIDEANICTIHKFTISLLQKLSLFTGLGSEFEISTDQYSRRKIYDAYLDSFIKNKLEEDKDFIKTIPIHMYELIEKLMRLSTTLLNKSIDLEEIKKEEMGKSNEYIPCFNELLTEVMIPAEKEYFNYMHTMNRMDLSECIIMLNKVLKERESLGLCRLSDLNIQYLFIDEFQDTDDRQIDLFVKLQKVIGDQCKLFVVGDLKQSIYRFRGASMSAFDRLTAFKFAWNSYSLNKNYRTDKRLLDLLDEVFSAMNDQKYLIYNESDRLNGVKEFNVDNSKILEVVNVDMSEQQEFFDSLFNVVKLQKNIIENDNKNYGEIGNKLNTIAILVRYNKQVEQIVAEGRSRNINVSVNSGGDLFQLQSTRDLYILLNALQNNANPLYLINFIQSNYINVTFDPICLHGLQYDEKQKILMEILDQYFLMKMNCTWKQLISFVHSNSILFVIKSIFDHLTPWKQYSDNKYSQRLYIMNYECLIENLLQGNKLDMHTLNSVLEYLRINITTNQKKQSRSLFNDQDNQVNIICTTIHKSKGLEYGTVILPFTNEDISERNREKLTSDYIDNKFMYFIKYKNKEITCNSNYQWEVQTLEQISEETRILYVALTRTIRNCIWFKNDQTTANINWAKEMEGEY